MKVLLLVGVLFVFGATPAVVAKDTSTSTACEEVAYVEQSPLKVFRCLDYDKDYEFYVNNYGMMMSKGDN